MRQSEAIVMRGQAKATPYWSVAARCRLMAYLAAVSPLLLLFVLASRYPALNQTEIPDWKPLVARADASLHRGDLYQARHLYLQVVRVASWREDWQGLVTAACRINRLDGINRPYSKALSVLFRASTAAELAQSRRGLATVAKSLSLLGSDEAASAVLARTQPSWPHEARGFDDPSLFQGCSRDQHR